MPTERIRRTFTHADEQGNIVESREEIIIKREEHEKLFLLNDLNPNVSGADHLIGNSFLLYSLASSSLFKQIDIPKSEICLKTFINNYL